jgi:hypothetical protein
MSCGGDVVGLLSIDRCAGGDPLRIARREKAHQEQSGGGRKEERVEFIGGINKKPHLN